MGFVHRRRRGAELFLLVLALAVGVGAYAAVGIGVEGSVPVDIVNYGGWLTGLVVAAHVAVRFVAPYADPVLLPPDYVDASGDATAQARKIADYIAGMTDRYAIREHRRLFSLEEL
eukprot:gene32745-36975_t